MLKACCCSELAWPCGKGGGTGGVVVVVAGTVAISGQNTVTVSRSLYCEVCGQKPELTVAAAEGRRQRQRAEAGAEGRGRRQRQRQKAEAGAMPPSTADAHDSNAGPTLCLPPSHIGPSPRMLDARRPLLLPSLADTWSLVR